MLAFTLARGVQDLEKRQGNNLDNWIWKKVTHVDFAHSPFSAIPGLKQIYSVITEGQSGNRRCINMRWYSQHRKRGPFSASGGSIFRVATDAVATNEYFGLSMDLGVESAVTG